MSEQSSIRVGTAGWSYPDWKGIVYPKVRPAGFHEVSYLAGYFDVLEINTSFYRPVPATVSAKWIQRVAHNSRFQFTAKLPRSFTHERRPDDDDERGFRQMADVLAGAGRLGAVLMQFPWSFRHTPENRRYLGILLERFAEYPRVVEIRHAGWNQTEFLKWLAERDAGFCNIDQPLIGESLEPSAYVTSPIGYVRLHGRNYQNWFQGETPGEQGSHSRRDARYDYLYSGKELEEWGDRVVRVAARAKTTYVIANNHFRGQAAANAVELLGVLRESPVPAPPALVTAYPHLESYAHSEQGNLFPGTGNELARSSQATTRKSQ